MSASLPASDFREFCDFVVRMRDSGAPDLTPEQSVAQFREDQEKLRHWHERNAISMEQARRGEAKPLDVEAVWSRVKERLAQEGIVD